MMQLDGLFTSFAGRISQQTFSAIAAGLLIVGLVFNQVPLFGPMLVLALLWPWSCLTAKRLHDAGRSAMPVGAVAAVCALIGAFGILLGIAAASPAYVIIAFQLASVVGALAGLACLAALALVLWAGLLRSDSGENRFGRPEAAPLNLTNLFSRPD
jgi:uncharacterized membrane protein YhaH (DUF805 family)